MSYLIKFLSSIVILMLEIFLLPFFLIVALLSRFYTNKVDVGLGPHPLINNVYHKKAILSMGYTVLTYVYNPYHITSDFDIIVKDRFSSLWLLGRLFSLFYLFLLPFKFKILYIYFNGGVFGYSRFLLWRVEPFLYKLAGIKVVVMPYGSDVQDMSRSNNLLFKQAMTIDYPNVSHRRSKVVRQIDLWTLHADHVISGCEWVDYMYHWDTLMISHFSIEPPAQVDVPSIPRNNNFKILHAPNHKSIKGTDKLVEAVNVLQQEGYEIELVMLEKVPNDKVLSTIASVDLVADQFVIGWYAMFAIEALSLGKPVMCYLREDLLQLYTASGLLEEPLPIINANQINVIEKLRWAIENRERVSEIGKSGPEFVQRYHSIEYIGKVFHKINTSILEHK